MSLFAKRFPAGRWSFLGLGSEKKWDSIYIDRPRGEGDRVAELMLINFEESGHPVFRATSPLSRGTLKSKGDGKLSIHFCANQDTITTVFRTFTSVNQLSLYGAVEEMCAKGESPKFRAFFSRLPQFSFSVEVSWNCGRGSRPKSPKMRVWAFSSALRNRMPSERTLVTFAIFSNRNLEVLGVKRKPYLPSHHMLHLLHIKEHLALLPPTPSPLPRSNWT